MCISPHLKRRLVGVALAELQARKVTETKGMLCAWDGASLFCLRIGGTTLHTNHNTCHIFAP